jgi:hypothetical protein
LDTTLEDELDDATETFLAEGLAESSAEVFFVGISDLVCCRELAPDPFLAGGFGLPAGDPLRYSRFDECCDVTVDCCDVTWDDVTPFCDDLAEANADVDFEKIV